MKEIKFDLNDIVIIPAEESFIDSRKQCKVYQEFEYDRETLPLMAAPMDTVVSLSNYQLYMDNGIIPCIPRGNSLQYPIGSPFYFMAFSLSELEEQLYDQDDYATPHFFINYPNILIDIANGHMSKLLQVVKDIKKKYPDTHLMVGNVANPETFANLALAGADYIRCSIGTGAGCTTAANVSINYPMGSLITECFKQKVQLGLWNTKIVADGGMKNYADIIKALALGADYVMIGSILNKSIESAGFNYLWKVKINNNIAKRLWSWGFPVKKKYRGMSTKAVQRSWGKSNLVTAEGITKYQNVEYTISQWTENFKDYLKSAMSYTNSKKLSDFIGRAEYVFISDASRKRFEK